MQNSPLSKIILDEREFFVKRDDLIDPYLAGNKYRKLYTLLNTPSHTYNTIISYGGTQSNAMLAIAAMCKKKKWQFIYYTKKLSDTQKNECEGNYPQALALGMEHKEIENEYDTIKHSLLNIKKDIVERLKPVVKKELENSDTDIWIYFLLALLFLLLPLLIFANQNSSPKIKEDFIDIKTKVKNDKPKTDTDNSITTPKETIYEREIEKEKETVNSYVEPKDEDITLELRSLQKPQALFDAKYEFRKLLEEIKNSALKKDISLNYTIDKSIKNFKNDQKPALLYNLHELFTEVVNLNPNGAKIDIEIEKIAEMKSSSAIKFFVKDSDLFLEEEDMRLLKEGNYKFSNSRSKIIKIAKNIAKIDGEFKVDEDNSLGFTISLKKDI
jgi:hypothetical protein